MTARMSREALAGWQEDPVLQQAGVWHEVGMITTGTSDEVIDYCREAYNGWVENGEGRNVKWLENLDDYRSIVPQVQISEEAGWKGFFHKRAGWADADRALFAFGNEAVRLGVKFVFGPKGTMRSLLLDSSGQAVGVLAEDGTEWIADRIVLCTGAWTDSLIDTEGQLEARCWTLAHLQLSPDECDEFKGIPVVLNLEEGKYIIIYSISTISNEL